MVNKKSVIVYQIGSLGDTLVSIPAYRAIRRHFGPDTNVHVLHNAPPNMKASPHQVLDGTNLIDGAVTFQQYGGRSSWRTWIEVFRKLHSIRTDTVVYVAPAERTSNQVKRDKLFFKICGIRDLKGFHAYDTELFTRKQGVEPPFPIPHEAVLRLERLQKDGIAVD